LQALFQRDSESESRKEPRSTRNYHLRHRYGITVDDFDRMPAAQGGLCAICREAPAERVDHDHATKLVRGLLCFNGNGALGEFRDRTDLMLRAVAYLRGDSVPGWAEPGLHYYLGEIADPRPPDEPRAA
jgi:hypothetical protein